MNGARVLITGASSGIGRALAVRMAQPGTALGLVARRRERLEELREELAGRDARVYLYDADVRDREAMQRVAEEFISAAGGVSVAIANAGVSYPDDLRRGDAEQAVELMATNLLGAINTLLPVIPHMIEARSGHLVAVGSVAGFRGLPGRGAYCASKSALKTLMDSYRPTLRPYGIRVTTICPGFVESELTAGNRFPMPFILSAERAAGLIVKALAKHRRTYTFPWQMRLLVPLIKAVPDRLLAPIVQRN
ncbi:MAG: SDR family NAD(P)-dependent oxidoreductase [SAR324 cluster bacterium]|nr:SDR family NAD(P)-dependent oxidoreductase [SAR324 cluster bacterium]